MRIFFTILITSSSLYYNQGYSADLSLIIKRYCLEEFDKEIINNDSKNKDIVGEFTCNCFLDKLHIGSSINNAKEICKEKASEKFNL